MSDNGNGSSSSNGNGSNGKGNGKGKGLGAGQRTLGHEESAPPEQLPIRQFGGHRTHSVPNLVQLQTHAYATFLQEDVLPEHRDRVGLESVLQEVFPIPSYDGTMELQYVGYELGSPRYTHDECRELKLTYGRPFKIRVRLQKESPVEEDVYLGEIPDHARRWRVHRERHRARDRHAAPPLAGCRLLGRDRGRRPQAAQLLDHSRSAASWIELNVTKKDVLAVRIDQSGKFPATSLLARVQRELLDPHRDRPHVLRDHARSPRRRQQPGRSSILGKHAAAWIFDKSRRATRSWTRPAPRTSITDEVMERIAQTATIRSGRPRAHRRSPSARRSTTRSSSVAARSGSTASRRAPTASSRSSRTSRTSSSSTTLREDTTESHDEALLRIYARLRPGNPPKVEKAK